MKYVLIDTKEEKKFLCIKAFCKYIFNDFFLFNFCTCTLISRCWETSSSWIPWRSMTRTISQCRWWKRSGTSTWVTQTLSPIWSGTCRLPVRVSVNGSGPWMCTTVSSRSVFSYLGQGPMMLNNFFITTLLLGWRFEIIIIILPVGLKNDQS